MKESVAGYLTHRDGCIGTDYGHGLFYDYILSGNGVFISATNEFLSACIPIAQCQIRGLTPTEPRVELRHGKIPGVFFDLALNAALARRDREIYFAITWQDRYRLFLTSQEGNAAHVEYHTLDGTVMGLHTHPTFAASFSGGDDRDEQGFRLEAVIGRLDRIPEVSLRVGVYGYFWPLSWTQVFDGTLNGVRDSNPDMKEVCIELSAGRAL